MAPTNAKPEWPVKDSSPWTNWKRILTSGLVEGMWRAEQKHSSPSYNRYNETYGQAFTSPRASTQLGVVFVPDCYKS